MNRIKIIMLCLAVFVVSCHKVEVLPIVPTQAKIDIFSQPESTINNGDTVMFKLNSDSTYVIKLVDKTTNQVISKERIVGKVGENKINIYTKSIQSKYLYLVLEGVNKNQINKTTIILN